MMGNKSRSYIRIWANSVKIQSSKRNLSKEAILMSALMMGVSDFGSLYRKTLLPSKSSKHRKPVTKYYTNDSTFFEIGCYLLYHIEIWLDKNYQNIGESISNILHYKFIDLINEALNIEYETVNELLLERIGIYYKVNDSLEVNDEADFEIIQLLLRTRENTLPKKILIKNQL